MRRADPLLLAGLLRNRSRRPAMDFGPVTNLASEQDFLNERSRQAQSLDRQFNTPVLGGEAAPIVGILRGISKAMQQSRGDAKLRELFDVVQADRAEIQKAEELKASQAAQAQRARELEDESRSNEEWRSRKQFEWANKPVDQLTPQDQLQMQQTQAQIASIMQQMQLRESDNERKDAEAGRKAQEAESMQEQKAATQDMLATNIEYLLDPANRDAMEAATGSISAKLPTFSQDTTDWENRFNFVKNALTSEKLDMMSGVLSESDIKILQSLAAGGIDLNSSAEAIQGALTKFYEAIKGEAPVYGDQPSDIDSLINKYGN